MKLTKTLGILSIMAMSTLGMTMSCNGANSRNSSDSAAVTDSAMAGAESAGTDAEIAAEAEKCLYEIYYDKDMLAHPQSGNNYAPAMVAKFKELGITQGVKTPYTKSFQALIDEVEKVGQEVHEKTGDLAGFDSDILWNCQGDFVDVNVEVVGREVKDADHVVLRAKFTNGTPQDRVYSMVRENGTFKIDDMDDTRAFAQEELQSSRKYLKEYEAQQGQP